MRAVAFVLALLPATAVVATLADAVSRAAPGTWVEYDAPLVDGVGSPCCVDWRRGHADPVHCTLQERSWNFSTGPDRRRDDTLRVFVRRGADGPDRVRAVGAGCAIDTGTAAVALVPGVDVAAAASYLGAAVPAMDRNARDDGIATIALHAGRAANDALARLAAPGQAAEVRRNALFWLGHTRGEDGLPVLRDTLARETDAGLLGHAVFALSQSNAGSARSVLRELARSDRRPAVRGEALFWLAQVKDAQAETLARAALADGSGKAVRDKAIFALAQLPPERAIPALEALARDRTQAADTRREALFWLAQQDDDRALDVFDELLGGTQAPN